MPSSVTLRFADPYEFQKSVRAAELQVVVTARGEYDAGLTRIDMQRLWMQRGRQSLASVVHSSVRADRSPIFFSTETDGKSMTHTGMEVIHGDLVFMSAGAEHHHRTPAGYQWGAMSLTPDDLAAYGRTLAGLDVTAPPATRVLRPRPELANRLLNLHKAAADLAATTPDILAHPEVARALEQQLIRTMIACLTDTDAVDSYRSAHQKLPVMRRFEELIEAKQNEPLYITEVCAAIGITDRTLRLHCQEHLGMSPYRYLWLRRMNLVRRALTRADVTKLTVTEIAIDHGFGELGRFAGAYRNLFGESPSATLRRPPDVPAEFPIVQSAEPGITRILRRPF